jgi:hypothetical protein|tara:strand:+ start:152 stop:379 length:228 start_codon:yes stop_codon:yes gene_type:complete
MASDLIKLSGLWVNKDKNGNEYFSGGFGYGAKILIMKNTFKEKENEPDYNLFIAPKTDKTGDKEVSKEAVTDIPY